MTAEQDAEGASAALAWMADYTAQAARPGRTGRGESVMNDIVGGQDDILRRSGHRAWTCSAQAVNTSAKAARPLERGRATCRALAETDQRRVNRQIADARLARRGEPARDLLNVGRWRAPPMARKSLSYGCKTALEGVELSGTSSYRLAMVR